MISTMKQSPRLVAISSSALKHGGIISLALSLFMAQSQIVQPAQQNNSNSGKRQHVATLHSSDSQEGSRVAISSDQSLNNYEAYRRGNRFYEPTNRNSAAKNINRNDARINPFSSAQANLNSNNKAASAGTSSVNATTTPPATPAAKASPITTTTQSQPDLWTRMKERGHYWLLLAQLNPIPVAVGAAILILIIGLLLVQRRRAKAPRRINRSPVETKKPNTESISETPSAPMTEPTTQSAVAIPLAAAAAVPFATQEIGNDAPAAAPVVPRAPAVEGGRRERVNQVAAEASKLFDGADYDEAVIGSEDRDTRRLVGAELLSVLVGRNPARRERARDAFMKHGYFDDATRDLRVAESDNERAAAARRLSFVDDREATPHLIGALNDPAPDVRRASVEALMDLRDPSAIGPLNSLLQTENDRRVPRTLIKHAIEACATSAPEAMCTSPAPATFSPPASQSIETEREVIEI